MLIVKLNMLNTELSELDLNQGVGFWRNSNLKLWKFVGGPGVWVTLSVWWIKYLEQMNPGSWTVGINVKFIALVQKAFFLHLHQQPDWSLQLPSAKSTETEKQISARKQSGNTQHKATLWGRKVSVYGVMELCRQRHPRPLDPSPHPSPAPSGSHEQNNKCVWCGFTIEGFSIGQSVVLTPAVYSLYRHL